MPRNYDEIRDAEDRSFVIRGETFTLRRVRPEILTDLVEMENALGESATYADLVKFAEERLLLLIDDNNGAAARWQTIRENPDDPVTYGELMDVSRWAVTEIKGLPTMPPSPSQPGAKTSGSSSKAK